MGQAGDIDSSKKPASFRRALAWSYVMHGGQYAITTIITLILAAILGPSAFGLVAMAMVYMTFIRMLLRQGMVPAIVQRRDLQRSHLDSAFWLIMASAVVLTSVSLLLSAWWAGVNRTPDLEPVIDILSALIPIQSLVVVQEAVLSRQMDFRGLAVRTNSAAVIGGIVALALAFAGFGVWALVAQHIARSLVEVVVLWAISDWRPRFHYSLAATRDLLGFSASSSLAGIGVFANNQADALLIGLFFGPTAVGLYRLAARIVNMVIDITVRSLQAVSLPELSRMQDDPKRFADRSVMIVKSSALLALPALGLVAGTSDVLMDLIGDQWAAASAPLKLLCVVGAVRALTMFIGPMLSALGRPHILALVVWVSAVLSSGSFVVAGLLLRGASVADQVFGIAMARMVLYSCVVLFLDAWLALRNTEISLAVLTRAVRSSALAAVVALAMTQMIASLVSSGLGNWMRLLVIAVPGAVLTIAVLLLFEPLTRRLLADASQRFRARSEARV